MNSPLLHSRRHAAKLLGIGIESLDKLIQRGELSVRIVGCRKKITAASIRDYIEKPVTRMTEAELDRAWRTGNV